MSGGEGGIRTRETSHPAYALSRRAYSSTLAPLRGRKEADPHVRASNSMQLWRFLCQPAYRPRMETNPVCGLLKSVGSVVAERAGFEPAIRVNVYRFSRAAPSTTRPPLLGQKIRASSDGHYIRAGLLSQILSSFTTLSDLYRCVYCYPPVPFLPSCGFGRMCSS